MERLARKFKRETGLEPTLKRLRAAEAFCNKFGLEPKDFRFENHYDVGWNRRRNRTPAQRAAVSVGRTNAQKAGQKYSHWWAVPKRVPK